MAPGVYETFIIDVVCSTLACRDDMICLYAFSRYKLTITHNFRELQKRLERQVVDNKKGAADNTYY